jgi:ribosomal protein S18 acetylase RimI-like enzyme
MPEIEIRPASENDIAALVEIDHSYTSGYVWQMEPHFESGHSGAVFREIRLPRKARVDYPRSSQALARHWKDYPGVLVAVLSGEPVGYSSLVENIFPLATSVMDLVVIPRFRRQGIGSALLLANLEWTKDQTKSHRLILEMQPKNFPAINLAKKLGFDFCGYIDNYFPNRDIAIFFTKWII